MSIRNTACLLFSLSLSTTANASQDKQVLWKNMASWIIQVSDSARPMCSARKFWDDGTQMQIGYLETSDKPQLLVENPAWNGQIGTGKFGLVVQFGSESPWRQPNSSSEEPLNLRVTARDLRFFENMMGVLNLNVKYAKNPVQNLSLDGAWDAYNELIRCQSLVTGTANN